MEKDNFIFWLQGFFELSEAKELTEKQVQIIKDHLKLVFEKVTPDRSTDNQLKIDPKIFQPGYVPWLDPYKQYRDPDFGKMEITCDVKHQQPTCFTCSLSPESTIIGGFNPDKFPYGGGRMY